MAERNLTENEYADLCEEAIEATARELGPNVDPAALAEAARDGKLLAWAVRKAEKHITSIQPSYRTPRESSWLVRLAALGAGKGGE